MGLRVNTFSSFKCCQRDVVEESCSTYGDGCGATPELKPSSPARVRAKRSLNMRPPSHLSCSRARAAAIQRAVAATPSPPHVCSAGIDALVACECGRRCLMCTREALLVGHDEGVGMTRRILRVQTDTSLDWIHITAIWKRFGNSKIASGERRMRISTTTLLSRRLSPLHIVLTPRAAVCLAQIGSRTRLDPTQRRTSVEQRQGASLGCRV